MRVPASLLVLLAAVALSACGAASSSSSKFQGTQRDVATVVDDLEAAASAKDASRICSSLLARSLLDELRRRDVDCRQAVGRALDAVDATQLDVKSVRVSGDTATARVESGSGDGARTRDVRLLREGRNWRIAQL